MTEEDPRPDGPPDAPAGRDDDAVWAEIVAAFHASPSAPELPPDEPFVEPPADGSTVAAAERAEDPAEGAGEPLPGQAQLAQPQLGPAQLGPRSYVPAEPAEEHYVPPPVAPLPPLHPVARAAWWGTIGGPVFLLGSALVGWTPPPWLVALAMTAFVAGFVTLVARMRRGDEEDGDDGAVV